MQQFFIVPDGGLVNRLRAVTSGIWLARKFDANPIVVWHRDELCNADLSQIILTDKVPAHIITPSEFKYLSLFDLPRKKNLYIPAVLSRLNFERRYYDDTNLFPFYCEHPECLVKEIEETTGKILFFSGQEFYDFPREFFREIIRPTEMVMERANEIMKNSRPEFSIQIRRTDHQVAIANSPLQLFTNIIDTLSPSPFFLATDDSAVKRAISGKYPSRAVINTAPAVRNTPEGIIDAMAEIVVMSKTRHIYASYESSFPDAASWIGNVPVTVMSKNL